MKPLIQSALKCLYCCVECRRLWYRHRHVLASNEALDIIYGARGVEPRLVLGCISNQERAVLVPRHVGRGDFVPVLYNKRHETSKLGGGSRGVPGRSWTQQ
jgi:hypothetical protein